MNPMLLIASNKVFSAVLPLPYIFMLDSMLPTLNKELEIPDKILGAKLNNSFSSMP